MEVPAFTVGLQRQTSALLLGSSTRQYQIMRSGADSFEPNATYSWPFLFRLFLIQILSEHLPESLGALHVLAATLSHEIAKGATQHKCQGRSAKPTEKSSRPVQQDSTVANGALFN